VTPSAQSRRNSEPTGSGPGHNNGNWTATAVHDTVNEGLAQDWSPQHIARRLKRDYPDDKAMHVSHEAIYETLFVQARGDCRTQLVLRSGRTRRVLAGSTRLTQARITG
jgi:transposase, IS30 family